MLLDMKDTHFDNDNQDTWQTLSAATDRVIQSLTKSKLTMKSAERGLVSRTSLLNGLKTAEMNSLVLEANPGNPSLPVAATQNSSRTRHGLSGKTSIGDVLRTRSQSQVDYSVVRRIAINMVDLNGGPFPINVKPNQTMDQVSAMVDDNHAATAATLINGTSDSADQALPIPRRLDPNKVSGFWIVAKYSADLISGNHDQSRLLLKLTEEKKERGEEQSAPRHDDEGDRTPDARYIQQRLRDIERFEQMVRGAIAPRRKRN